MASISEQAPVAEGVPRKGLTLRTLLDSAFAIAAISASCYAVGRLVNLRDSTQLGLPAHLLPVIPAETTVLIGGLHLIFLALILYMLFLLLLLLDKLTLGVPRGMIGARFSKMFADSPGIYGTLMLLLAVCVPVITVFWVPLSYTGYYDERRLPNVINIVMKDDKALKDKTNLKYLSSTEDLVILKRSGKKEFVIIRKDELSLLSFESPAVAERKQVAERPLLRKGVDAAKSKQSTKPTAPIGKPNHTPKQAP